MTPVTREEIYLTKLAGGSVTVPSPVSRKEMYLAKACGEAVTVPTPVSREEMYLYKLAGGMITLPPPVSRLELLMAAACGEAVTPYPPVSRIEWFWAQLLLTTISGVPPITFLSDGSDLTAWSISGNSQQTGTPTPDAPIYPDFVGTLSAGIWTIPITSAGQTQNVYLGQVQTVRWIRKLTFTGQENWQVSAAWKKPNTSVFFYEQYDMNNTVDRIKIYVVSDKFNASSRDDLYNGDDNMISKTGGFAMTIRVSDSIATTVSDFKSWLASNPVTVWYVLAEPKTGIINEPLAKIGDYADELHSEDAVVTIPTAPGSNTLTIDTTLQPSSVSITGHISP